MTQSQVARLIDHTLLRADATAEEIRKLCVEARQYGFFSVCVNSYWVSLAAAELAGSAGNSGVKVCSVVGFPLGAGSTVSKVQETADAVRNGASEIDMVINIGELKGGNLSAAEADIRAVVEAAHSGHAIVKVILETCLLDDRQKTAACKLSQAAGAAFVKTSTGFSTAGATVPDVALMRAAAGSHMGVKASGGIRSLEDLEKMVAAGANRIGASSSVKIVDAASR